MPVIAPTKGNLSKIKRSLALAKMGYELMDRKRNILIREMMLLIDSAKQIQAEIDTTFTRAYSALQEADIKLGACQDIALATPVDDSLQLGYRSVMGVEIPDVDPLSAETIPSYSFHGSSGAMDAAYAKFRRVMVLVAQLAEIETSVYRLAVQIRKTHRRVNALEKVVIPQDKAEINFISDVLEEGEREDFTRMKLAQKKIKE